MAATTQDPACDFDVAGDDHHSQTWGRYEGGLDLGSGSTMAGASVSSATRPSPLESNIMWSPAMAGASPESTEPTPQSRFEDLFSTTMSPRPSTAASSLFARRPSAEADLFPEIDPSVIPWAQDEFFPGVIEPTIQDNEVYPQLLQSSPFLSYMPRGPENSSPHVVHVPVPPTNGFSLYSSLWDSHTSGVSSTADLALPFVNTSIAPVAPVLCPLSGNSPALSGLPAFPASMDGYPPPFSPSAVYTSDTWTAGWDPGMARGSIMSPVHACPIQCPPGGPSTASYSPGAITIHVDVPTAEVCRCPHTHGQPVSSQTEASSSSPKPPSGSGNKRKRQIKRQPTAGSPPKKTARERRKEERPDKCPLCGEGFQYPRELRKHIAAQHKDDAHRYGVSTARHPCPAPGCGRHYARPDHLTRHRKEKGH